MSLPQVDMLPASMTGLRLATERYQAAAQDPGSAAVDVFVPLSEALAWACSLDEAMSKIYGEPYVQARATDPMGPYLVGLRFARNRCTHQLALIAERRHLAPPLRPPLTPGLLFRWRPVAELPAADAKHDNGRVEYEDCLVGNTAQTTLGQVTGWLQRAFEQFV
jgi:hypothetical protein